jgi:AhpD family alkylhydroperoxidase
VSADPRIPRPEGGDPALGVLAYQPELAAAFFRLYGELWSRGVVDQPTKEVVRLRNARITDCGFCKNVRFSGAREQGLTEDLVRLIDDGYETSLLSERHKAALRFADVFLHAPARLDERTRAEMLHHFTPEEIVELAAALALFLGFSKIAVALGTAPKEMPLTLLPTPL